MGGKEAIRDPRFKIVQLSRNFHMEGGMLAWAAQVDPSIAVL